jgi:hypothetical protein
MSADNNSTCTLYTAGYRDAVTDKRLTAEEFYASLPEEAAVVDIRSHPYSPFAPYLTGGGVEQAVRTLKPGVKTFYHLRALGNTHREGSGKRVSPPVYVDPDTGFETLERYLRKHGAVLIFCACSYATRNSSTHRCHRFFVAEEMQRRMPGLKVVHVEEDDGP